MPADLTVRVQPQPFDVSSELAALTGGRTDVGGIGCFVGTVRDSAKGRPIVAMTLEHYPGMTERAMAAIAAEAMQRWDLLGCTLIHRVGRLEPGDNIVLVVAVSAHRQAALDAFYEQSEAQPLNLLKWLAVQASRARPPAPGPTRAR